MKQPIIVRHRRNTIAISDGKARLVRTIRATKIIIPERGLRGDSGLNEPSSVDFAGWYQLQKEL